MSIVASSNLSLIVSRNVDMITKETRKSISVQASGLIEGADITVPLNPDISKVTGVAEAMQALLDAADAALAGKTADIATAVAAPKVKAG